MIKNKGWNILLCKRNGDGDYQFDNWNDNPKKSGNYLCTCITPTLLDAIEYCNAFDVVGKTEEFLQERS